MNRLGQKKFLLQTTSGTYFGVLSIIVDPNDLNERGTLTLLHIDEYGFAKPWEDDWYSIGSFDHVKENLIERAEEICAENGVELYRY